MQACECVRNRITVASSSSPQGTRNSTGKISTESRRSTPQPQIGPNKTRRTPRTHQGLVTLLARQDPSVCPTSPPAVDPRWPGEPRARGRRQRRRRRNAQSPAPSFPDPRAQAYQQEQRSIIRAGAPDAREQAKSLNLLLQTAGRPGRRGAVVVARSSAPDGTRAHALLRPRVPWRLWSRRPHRAGPPPTRAADSTRAAH